MESTVSDTIDRMITTTTKVEASSSSSSSLVVFIPSVTFQGSKAGYYFGTSLEHGTGYHLDDNSTTSCTSTNHKKRSNLESSTTASSSFSSSKKVRIVEVTKTTKKKKKTGEELLAEAEQSWKEADYTPKIFHIKGEDERGTIQQACLQLSKIIQKNQKQRLQYPDQPEQFMESELLLHDEINSLKAIATNLSFYPHLHKTNNNNNTTNQDSIITQLQSLLTHENADIALSVILLFVELLDPSLLQNNTTTTADDDIQHMMGLIHHAMDSTGLELIVSNLGRLNIQKDDEEHDEEEEEEEIAGIDNILTLIENILEMESIYATTSKNPPISNFLVQETNLLSWMFHYLSSSSSKKKQTTANSLYLHVTEVLALLLQQQQQQQQNDSFPDLSQLPPFSSAFSMVETKSNKKKQPSTQDGMEILLQAIALYRKKDPQTEEDCESLENIFTILSSSLLSSNQSNVSTFLEGQGIELMLRCIREKVHSGGGSLKVLSYCLSTSSSSSSNSHHDAGKIRKQACETFVDAGGLKHLFPLFMGRTSSYPKPAKCSDAGSSLAKKQIIRAPQNKKKLGKQAKLAFSARKEWIQQLEIHSIQILYALTLFLDESSPHDAKARLVTKFLEADKCQQLVDLLLKYDTKMRIAEYKFYKSDEAETLEETYGTEEVDLAALNAKLKAGGDIFFRIGAIIGFACTGSKRCHQTIVDALKAKNSGIGVVKAALTGFVSILDDGFQTRQLQSYLEAIV